MIYKCGLNALNVIFTVSVGQRRIGKGTSDVLRSKVSNVAKITFVKVTVGKQRSFRTQRIEVIVSKE